MGRLIKSGDRQRCKLIKIFGCCECGAIFTTGPHERYVEDGVEWARCLECNSPCDKPPVPIEWGYEDD